MKKNIVTILCVAVFLSACSLPNNTPKKPNKTQTEKNEKHLNEVAPTDQKINKENLNDPLLETQKSINETIKDINAFTLKNSENFQSCMSFATNNCIESSALEISITKKSDSSCDLITNEDAKQNCKNIFWNEIAKQEQKIDLCNNITEDSQKNTCQNQVITEQAITAKNIQLCEQISIPKNTLPNIDGLEEPFETIESYEKQNCLDQVAATIEIENTNTSPQKPKPVPRKK